MAYLHVTLFQYLKEIDRPQSVVKRLLEQKRNLSPQID